ncbi:MAG TPA: tRNA (guanosine(46)-N7)-methyltransferase TrmB [Kiritimatiellia bacterium]|nr:tRNA (guanosine(46)-N7)-methyltransferase TrmB [Kiritimatiellia bacterium]HMP34982.1 tRNA (guanosine(46)-N7)-methyltransferase TrmB [Kiritimatiellia bacterium]
MNQHEPAAMPATLRHCPEDWLNPVDLVAVFGRPGPVHVDLGCGKGRFLMARAAAFPGVNFLGIDRMLRRIRKNDNKARRLGLANIRLMRIEGYYAVSYLLPPAAIDTYFILFPDPWPKKKHHDHRLFNPRFVDALHRTLKPGGVVHLATDHWPYFEEIAAILRADARFTETEPFVPTPEERTDFELWYIDKKPIGRCSFIRNP